MFEIQNAERDYQRMMMIVDEIVDADYYHPSHKSTLDTAHARMRDLSQRIRDLKAML